MEKKGVLVPLVLAILAFAFYQMTLGSREKAFNTDPSRATVLIASADIPERTVLNENVVETMEVPRKYMQQDVFEIRGPSDMRQIINLVTRTSIPKGNQITQSSLTAMSPESGLSVKIPPGYRGAMLPIEPEMKELIKPGDRVDVLVTFDAMMNDGKKEKVTATILQNVLVIAVGTFLGQGMNAKQFKTASAKEDANSAMAEKTSVSLALNPNEAQYLSLALKQGDPTVVMRGLGDIEMHPMEMASFRKLFR